MNSTYPIKKFTKTIKRRFMDSEYPTYEKNGEIFFFKNGFMEGIKEAFHTQLLRKLEIPVAEYTIAFHRDKLGCITKSFLTPGDKLEDIEKIFPLIGAPESYFSYTALFKELKCLNLEKFFKFAQNVPCTNDFTTDFIQKWLTHYFLGNADQYRGGNFEIIEDKTGLYKCAPCYDFEKCIGLIPDENNLDFANIIYSSKMDDQNATFLKSNFKSTLYDFVDRLWRAEKSLPEISDFSGLGPFPKKFGQDVDDMSEKLKNLSTTIPKNYHNRAETFEQSLNFI